MSSPPFHIGSVYQGCTAFWLGIGFKLVLLRSPQGPPPQFHMFSQQRHGHPLLNFTLNPLLDIQQMGSVVGSSETIPLPSLWIWSHADPMTWATPPTDRLGLPSQPLGFQWTTLPWEEGLTQDHQSGSLPSQFRPWKPTHHLHAQTLQVGVRLSTLTLTLSNPYSLLTFSPLLFLSLLKLHYAANNSSWLLKLSYQPSTALGSLPISTHWIFTTLRWGSYSLSLRFTHSHIARTSKAGIGTQSRGIYPLCCLPGKVWLHHTLAHFLPSHDAISSARIALLHPPHLIGSTMLLNGASAPLPAQCPHALCTRHLHCGLQTRPE